ncbi:MAG: hydantoinase/oxoprolinase family protein [Kiloniellales bacterium]|nr:hydantoinase/oxoprolinase family protein [Kiloniellales bacterium]
MLLGIDTGGTYCDAVLYDRSAGVTAAAKALTTKHDLSLCIGEVMTRVLTGFDPGHVQLVSLSTTLATNAVVEGHGAPVCLILIGYDEAALQRASLGAAIARDPVVFLAGGHGPLGDEQAPLDREGARAAIAQHAGRVEAFAVAGYFSVRNPSHELWVRDLVRETTGLPVTCAHELTSNLDAPRRALTAVLNARLIPQIQTLVLSVRERMKALGAACPLMVVKGDGSLITDEVALMCPVETILSGPAASVVGAQALSGESDIVVSDIGGTTTDIAVLRGGRPVLDSKGAVVGGWRTMVEALSVHTFGLGGDSDVRLADEPWPEGPGLEIGPRRVVPLSLLGHQRPAVLSELQAQIRLDRPRDWDGRFALRLRTADPASLGLAERRLWDALGDGPQPLNGLLRNFASMLPLSRLVERGLVIYGGFTPSDAAHLLGKQQDWSLEAARLGAELLARRGLAERRLPAMSAEALAELTLERVVERSGEVLVEALLAEEGERPLEVGKGPGRRLIGRALKPAAARRAGLIAPSLGLTLPLVAVGAPAASYYPVLAERLGARRVVPPHAEVCNAVGAVAGGVTQRVKVLVTAPAEHRYRVHLPDGPRDFPDREAALGLAREAVRDLAREQAVAAGASAPDIELEEIRREAEVVGGDPIFVEAEVIATAAGRPRLA